jgi:TolB-like protein/tetratricopeptide (TPR) repeat protein
MSLIAELKRRNVLRVAALYVLAAWVTLQIAEVLFGLLDVPPWAGKLVFGLLLLGLVPTLLFAWIYELTPEGLKKQHEVDRAQSITPETGRKINYAIGALAVIAILVVAADRLVPRDTPAPAATLSSGVPEVPAGPAVKSIAVLPFVDMSPAKDQEYFTDGISEELLNLLAKIPDLMVIGRTSSFQFKGRNEDLRVIGQKLNVAHILEGSVRKSGDAIRITAQLVRADSGAHLWSQTYDRKLDDIFAVQDEIAGEVVKALKVRLLGVGLPPPPRTADAEAHSLYLQGRFFASRRAPGDMEKSVEYLTRALERDPGFANAWVELARAYTNMTATSTSPEKMVAKAREAAQRATEADPRFADGYAVLVFIANTYDWNWAEATRLLQRARELDPNGIRTKRNAALVAATLGNFDEAIPLYRELTEIEPLEALHFFNYGLVLRNAGRLSEAEQALRKALELSPEGEGFMSLLAGVQVLAGQPAAALESLERETAEVWKTLTLPIVLHAAGRGAESDRALAAVKEQNVAGWAFQIAEAHAFRGETDQAFEWLARAYENRDPGLTEIRGDPFLKPIEGDPRYRELLHKMGLP